MFVRTFVDGYKKPEKRVQAQEWLEALKPIIEKFESKQCAVKIITIILNIFRNALTVKFSRKY